MSREEVADGLRSYLWTPDLPAVTEEPRQHYGMGREVYAWYVSARRPAPPPSFRHGIATRVAEETIDLALGEAVYIELERLARGAWPGARFWIEEPRMAWGPETAMAWSVARWRSFESQEAVELAVSLPVARARLRWCAAFERVFGSAIPFARTRLGRVSFWRQVTGEMLAPGPRRQDWRPGHWRR